MLPTVSVCIFSYNYEKYIAQAIESVLSQQTSFAVEIIIGDDCSTDRTREIAAEYNSKYPEQVLLSFNKNNMGGTRNWIHTMNQCRGKYIALLDGDDYFIDPLKLQKQYDILETDATANLVFHSVKELYENRGNLETDVVFKKDFYNTEDLLKQGWFIRTSSLFFRNGILPRNPPEWVYNFPYRYDTILIVLLSINSKAVNCKDVMTVWRRHDAGLSYAITKNYLKNYELESALYQHLDEVTGYKNSSAIKKYIQNVRTAVVFNALKSFSLKPILKLQLSAFNISYSLLLSMIKNTVQAKLSKSNG